MPFVKMPGIDGEIWVPEISDEPKKHNCKDCFSCQWCSDERCASCLRTKKTKKMKKGLHTKVRNG